MIKLMLIKKLEPDLARDFKPFDDWWESKEKGPVVWYDGYLPLDRAVRETKTSEQNAEASYINAFAKLVWSLYNDGLVTLFQSKMHIFRYLYFIERKQ